MNDRFDCVVVGSGPGGYVAAIRAAQLGMRTAIVEREPSVGGRCLNWACIPAKTVLRSADALSGVRNADRYGIETGPAKVNFEAVSERRNAVIHTLSGGVRSLLKKNRVELVNGEAALGGAGTVLVGDREVWAGTAVVLATGSVRRAPRGVAFGGRVIGTEEAWSFTRLPASLAVLGAGASGAEIASAYARLGSRVVLIEAAARILPTEEAEVSEVARHSFEEQGIDVRAPAQLTDVRSDTDSVSFSVDGEPHQAEWLVLATGRAPDVTALRLEQAGVAMAADGLVAVDGHLRTSVPGVYAIGDMVSGPALAHKASEEGIIAVETAAGNDVAPLPHADIPRATFCSPGVGSVGLTEEAASAAGYDVTVGKVPYRAVGAGVVLGDGHGLIKLVGDRSDGAVLGAHIVGARAPELIQQVVNIRHLEGGYPEMARLVHGHPTLSEGLAEAARAADGWLIHG